MARIVYGVAGEGFGHSSRSHLIGQHLIDAGHEVLFLASRKSLAYLRPHFGPDVKEICGLSLVYRNRRLSPARTLATNACRFVRQRGANRALYRDVLELFAPDLVISDFEPFSAWWALRRGVPFISIDHQHMLSLCRLDHGAGSWTSRVAADVVTRCHYTGAAAYLVLNFFRTAVKRATALVAPPVVRPEVQQLVPTDSDHLVVYTTDASWKANLLATLARFPRHTFFIYGLDASRRLGNCVLKKTSTTDFLRDLASSRGVIATAGFSLISECLHLRKKMLLLPIEGQYEQMVNARYMEKLGLGFLRKRLDAGSLADYLTLADRPMPDHADILWPDNERFFRILSQTMHGVFSTFETPARREPAVGGNLALG
jgi:uncharacterized protein (TIGR00661 family)